MTALAEARREAEEALMKYGACPPEANLSCVTCTPRLSAALRSLLAALPQTEETPAAAPLPVEDEFVAAARARVVEAYDRLADEIEVERMTRRHSHALLRCSLKGGPDAR